MADTVINEASVSIAYLLYLPVIGPYLYLPNIEPLDVIGHHRKLEMQRRNFVWEPFASLCVWHPGS